MSDFQKGIVYTCFAMAACAFFFGIGANTGKRVLAADCENYGATRIDGQMYECKLK